MPSLLEALETKYFSNGQNEAAAGSDSESGSNDDNLISIYIPRLPPLLCVPELLVLNDCDIDCAGNFQTIKDKCQRVRELDLAQNKLQDWSEIFDIIKHMPRIEFLNLSKNYLMAPISRSLSTPPPTISNLRGLVLNGTYLDWECIDVLLDNLPILEELHLSLNNYDEVLIDTAPEMEMDYSCQLNENCLSQKCLKEECRCGQQQQEQQQENCSPNANCEKKNCQRRRKKICSHNALRTLHFTGNPIESWPEVCRLGRVFPNMENLVLADCPIKSLTKGNTTTTTTKIEKNHNENDNTNTTSCPINSTATASTTNTSSSSTASASTTAATHNNENLTHPHKHFQNLLFLNLSCANINTWDDIDQLAAFPKLTKLRAKNWPLWENLESTEHERRQLLIARLPNVTQLNGGGTITADEREDAERAFIRYYMEKPETERPLRYHQLVAKHGKLDPLVNINLKPDKRVKIFLVYGDSKESRMVDVYRTVSDLKLRLEKILGLAANKMRLYYLDKDYREMGPEEMKYPNKMLYSYNIQTGDEIIVDEKK